MEGDVVEISSDDDLVEMSVAVPLQNLVLLYVCLYSN